jgi:hypothetical protein
MYRPHFSGFAEQISLVAECSAIWKKVLRICETPRARGFQRETLWHCQEANRLMMQIRRA